MSRKNNRNKIKAQYELEVEKERLRKEKLMKKRERVRPLAVNAAKGGFWTHRVRLGVCAAESERAEGQGDGEEGLQQGAAADAHASDREGGARGDGRGPGRQEEGQEEQGRQGREDGDGGIDARPRAFSCLDHRGDVFWGLLARTELQNWTAAAGSEVIQTARHEAVTSLDVLQCFLDIGESP
ncbi:unnamed protein product [Phytophthora lilii]|uniref:Unnamed protein product n=1 Tax=Phytophthora lilii TaxID=2077276 RepID=A0A9W6TW55_9STRA|nr:unnamed protein product [Phytophthora lilii]